MLSPQKNRSGQRSYRRRDVEMALRIKELLYDEMFTIAGAKKKLQSEVRETSKLKIVHPDRARDAGHDNPSLFDEELEIDGLAAEVENRIETSTTLDVEQREALRSLAANLLELREMLRRTSA
jgi:DNA-binding transcriptional MerR regulator